MFPSLVNCCTIDWFTEWPSDALLGVATSFFQPVDLGCSDDVKVMFPFININDKTTEDYFRNSHAIEKQKLELKE